MEHKPTSDYVAVLQRAIEYHCKGKLVPDSIANECPHHAALLDRHLTSRLSRAADACGCKDGGLFDFGNSNICVNCGGTIPPPA